MLMKDCIQPWYELQVQYDGQVRFCCYYVGSDTLNPHEATDISVFWNSPTIQKARQEVVSGNPVGTGCSNCQMLKYETPGRLFDSYDQPYLNDVQRKNLLNAKRNFDEKKIIVDSWPVKYYFNFGLPCNLRCDFCTQKIDLHVKKDLRQLSYEFLDKNKPHLIKADEFAVIGGEPLVIPSCRKFIKAMANDPVYHDVLLSIYTNGVLLHKNMEDLRKLKRVTLVVSLDSVGETYEKIRITPKGKGNWPGVRDNILNFIREGKEDSQRDWRVHVAGIVMKESLYNIHNFVKWCIETEAPVHFVPFYSITPQDRKMKDPFNTPTLLDDVPGWHENMQSAVDQLNEKGWTASANTLNSMKIDLDRRYRNRR